MVGKPPACSLCIHYMVGCKGHLWMSSKMAEAVSMVQGKPTQVPSQCPALPAGQSFSLWSSPELQAVLPGYLSCPSLSFFYEAPNHAEHGFPSVMLSLCCHHKAVMGNRCQGAFAAIQQGWRGQDCCQSTESLSFVNGFLTQGLSDSVFPQPQLPSPQVSHLSVPLCTFRASAPLIAYSPNPGFSITFLGGLQWLSLR